MKTAVITGPRQVRIENRPTPHASGDFVVVKITVAPMCTEYKLYRDGYPSDMLGHEAAGEVVDVAQPGRVKVGDRVVVMPQYPCGRCGYCLSGDYIHCQNNIDPLVATGNTTGTATYAQYVLKVDAVRRRGQIAFVAEAGSFTLHISNDLLRKGLVVHGIWHWNLADTPRMLQVIRSCGNLLSRMITHRFPLTRVQEAWELQLTGNCGKVILYPWQE